MSRQNILIGVLVVVILGSGYVYFFTGGPSLPLTATATPSDAEQQFLELSNKLTSIDFDTSVFTDPRLAQLVDLATPIAPERQGRADPFAALGR